MESSFLAENLHAISSNFQPRVVDYVKEKKDFWLNFSEFGNSLCEFHPNNLQKCNNILQMSFMNSTYLVVVQALHNGSSADGIAAYVPYLKRETADAMAESILKHRQNDEKEMKISSMYPRTLDPLIKNIVYFSPVIREKIRKDFYEALSALTCSIFSSKPHPEKVLGCFRFYDMCQAIKKLPSQEQEYWKFITDKTEIYKPWFHTD